MDLPRFYLFGDRPVKIIRTEDGGADTLAYNWETGEFERAPTDYLPRALFGSRPDDERVSEEVFERQVKKLRAELGKE